MNAKYMSNVPQQSAGGLRGDALISVILKQRLAALLHSVYGFIEVRYSLLRPPEFFLFESPIPTAMTKK